MGIAWRVFGVRAPSAAVSLAVFSPLAVARLRTVRSRSAKVSYHLFLI